MVAIQDVHKLGLGDLLGSLLAAVIDAHQHSIQSSLDFVKQVGFITEDGQERLRTVTIRHTKLDENQQPAEFTLEMPLLAMVNIPTLGVKTANVSFSYDILETVPLPAPQPTPTPAPLPSPAPAPSPTPSPAPKPEPLPSPFPTPEPLPTEIRLTSTIDRPLLADLAITPVELRGIIRRTPSNLPANAAGPPRSLDVNVTLEREPTPLGIERLLDLAELAMTEQQVDQPEG